jgi:hypothetical protein
MRVRCFLEVTGTWCGSDIGRGLIGVGPVGPGRSAFGGSDDFDGHVASVRGERFDVGRVAGEDRAAGLGYGYHKGVDGGAAAGASSQLGGAAGNGVGHDRLDDAGLEEPVGVGVAAGVTLERLHEHDGRHERWPQLVVDELSDERKRASCSCGQPRDAAAVEDEHGSDRSVELAVSDPTDDRFGPGFVARGRFANLGGELGDVLLRGVEGLAALDFGAYGDLE